MCISELQNPVKQFHSGKRTWIYSKGSFLKKFTNYSLKKVCSFYIYYMKEQFSNSLCSWNCLQYFKNGLKIWNIQYFCCTSHIVSRKELEMPHIIEENYHTKKRSIHWKLATLASHIHVISYSNWALKFHWEFPCDSD